MTIPISELLLQYMCPIAGGITATIMFAAPLPDAYRAVRYHGQLGPLNSLPWAFMLGNCYGWILYGVTQRNFFVYCANVPGFFFSIYLNMQALKLQYKKYDVTLSPHCEYSTVARRETTTITTPSTPSSTPNALPMTQDIWILIMVFVWLLLTSILGFQQNTISSNQQQLLIGSAVNLNLVVFYAAPLSTIYQVMYVTQSSASIHVPTMLTNTANGVFWCAYGLAVQDWFIAVPNGLGAALGSIQMVLRVVFPVQASVHDVAVAVVEDTNVQVVPKGDE